MMDVVRAVGTDEMNAVFRIRKEVFVKEQKVPEEEEYDEFESTSRHFLARCDAKPCGTARWRFTSEGVKLERFAVLKKYRGRGVGQALVRAVLNDVFSQQPEPIERIYLHAQVSAMPLYAGFGFKAIGEQFDECGIQHYKMILPVSQYPR